MYFISDGSIQKSCRSFEIIGWPYSSREIEKEQEYNHYRTPSKCSVFPAHGPWPLQEEKYTVSYSETLLRGRLVWHSWLCTFRVEAHHPQAFLSNTHILAESGLLYIGITDHFSPSVFRNKMSCIPPGIVAMHLLLGPLEVKWYALHLAMFLVLVCVSSFLP